MKTVMADSLSLTWQVCGIGPLAEGLRQWLGGIKKVQKHTFTCPAITSGERMGLGSLEAPVLTPWQTPQSSANTIV